MRVPHVVRVFAWHASNSVLINKTSYNITSSLEISRFSSRASIPLWRNNHRNRVHARLEHFMWTTNHALIALETTRNNIWRVFHAGKIFSDLTRYAVTRYGFHISDGTHLCVVDRIAQNTALSKFLKHCQSVIYRLATREASANPACFIFGDPEETTQFTVYTNPMRGTPRYSVYESWTGAHMNYFAYWTRDHGVIKYGHLASNMGIACCKFEWAETTFDDEDSMRRKWKIEKYCSSFKT